jgi:hypothetical protein
MEIPDEKIQEMLRGDRGIAVLLEPILNQILQSEMTEHLGAESGERRSKQVFSFFSGDPRRSLAIASPAPAQGPDAEPEPVAPGALAEAPPDAVIGTGCGPEAGTDSRKIVSCGKPSLAENHPLRKTIRRNPATRFPVTESRFQSHFNHQEVAPRQASASRRFCQSVPAGTNRRGSSKYPSNRADIPAGRCLGWMFRMCALPGDCTACGVCPWRRRVRVVVFVSPCW